MSGNGPQPRPNTELASDGLPKQFVSSLRILFDILDENRTGFVCLKDIESRWSDDGVRGLPAGVVDGLRRVTPHDGLLSFEKFVAGLKLVLHSRRVNESRKPFASKENRLPYDVKVQNETNHQYIDSQSGYVTSRRGVSNVHNIVNEPPVNPSQQRNVQRHGSNSQSYSDRFNENDKNAFGQPTFRPQQDLSTVNSYAIKADVRNYPVTMGSHQSPSFNQSNANNDYSGPRGYSRSSHLPENPPPALPPRSNINQHVPTSSYLPSQMRKSQSGPDLQHAQTPPTVPPRVHRPNSNPHILADLKNWQKEWTANQNPSRTENWHNNRSQRVVQASNNNNDKHAIYANIDQFQRRVDDPSKQGPQKATVRRHGSGRRHTLSSGIDQNMLKRMKQLEEEKAVLQSGLGMVDSAKDWYLKQLSVINDKQAMLGKVSYNDNSLEAHEERMSFQKARVAEVNQQLAALVESSEKGFPLHMNLAVSNRTNAGNNDKTLINRNRKLMEEVSHKTNHISQLEKEKASLIRELFEARSKNKASHDDTTFM